MTEQGCNGAELSDKGFAMPFPTPRIGQAHAFAAPAGACDRAANVWFDGAQQSDDARRREFDDSTCKRRFGGVARCLTERRGKGVGRVGAEIDEVAARIAESFQERFIGEPRVRGDECLEHRAIEARILLVEEAPGSGRRFTDEERAYLRRPEAAAQPFLPEVTQARPPVSRSPLARRGSRRRVGPRN